MFAQRSLKRSLVLYRISFARRNNHDARGLQAHSSACHIAALISHRLLQQLALTQKRLDALGKISIVALVNHLNALLGGSSALVTERLGHIHLGVDLSAQPLIRNANFLVQPVERLLARILINIGDDVLRKIKHTVQVAARYIQQDAHEGGHAAGVPNVRNRRSQNNVTHALAAHGSTRNFHAAFVALDAFVADVFVLAAIALPVFLRAKNSLAEQPVFFRPQAAVVDRLGLRNLAIRP